jgi:molecular chaperone IbpA
MVAERNYHKLIYNPCFLRRNTMTNTLPFFSDIYKFDKFFVGADSMMKSLAKAHDTIAKTIPGYPPYNIAKTDENKYVIEMAVAGFGKQNIDIEMDDGTLTIKGGMTVNGMAEETVNPIQYVYKGIADRAFTRKFAVSDTVEVKNAELINGMLKVWLENIIPDHKKPKKVEID